MLAWSLSLTMTSLRCEIDGIKRDARSSEGKTAQQRMEMFADLLETVDCIWNSLTPGERRRRMWISDQLHRRPEPWWQHVRAEDLTGLK